MEDLGLIYIQATTGYAKLAAIVFRPTANWNIPANRVARTERNRSPRISSPSQLQSSCSPGLRHAEMQRRRLSVCLRSFLPFWARQKCLLKTIKDGCYSLSALKVSPRNASRIGFLFKTAVRIVTLLSFTVHAVIGCCAHHSHGLFHDETCESNRKCGHHQTPARQAHDVEAATSSCCHPEAIALDGSDAGYPDSPEMPCNDSHQCNETICSFLAGSSVSLDFESLNDESCYLNDFNRCVLQRSLTHFKPSNGLHWKLGCRAFVFSCVILQTWQI